MSQLLRLPVDELKIDRSFITDIEEDLRAQAILSATVELGRTLGLSIVAEGIETPAALDAVTARGVGTAQGFFFSRALPPGRFRRVRGRPRQVGWCHRCSVRGGQAPWGSWGPDPAQVLSQSKPACERRLRQLVLRAALGFGSARSTLTPWRGPGSPAGSVDVRTAHQCDLERPRAPTVVRPAAREAFASAAAAACTAARPAS